MTVTRVRQDFPRVFSVYFLTMDTFHTNQRAESKPASVKFDVDKLAEYLRSNVKIFPQSGKVKLTKFSFGQSNPTFLVECDNQKFVLRKKPHGKLLPSAHAIDREYRVMSALQSTKVPVPRTYHFCTNKSIIGTEFYVCEFINGRVFKSGILPSLTKAERHAAYLEYCRVIALIHSVDIHKLNLTDYGGSGRYLKKNKNKNKKMNKNINIYDHCARLRSIWNAQFKRSETKEVAKMPITKKFFDKINLYQMSDNNEIETLVHGDYHFANLIWHPTEIRILAVVDWELSTIGNPMNDVATCALVYYYPFGSPDLHFRGLNGTNVKEYGVPTEYEFLQAYFQNLRKDSQVIKKMDLPIKDWNFYIALQLHRYIAVFQGIHHRNVHGTASNPSKIPIVATNEFVARMGLNVLNQRDIFQRQSEENVRSKL